MSPAETQPMCAIRSVLAELGQHRSEATHRLPGKDGKDTCQQPQLVKIRALSTDSRASTNTPCSDTRAGHMRSLREPSSRTPPVEHLPR